MPAPLMDGAVDYDDGTEASASQMAKVWREGGSGWSVLLTVFDVPGCVHVFGLDF